MAIEATGVENVMEEVAHFWQLRKFQFIEEATDFWMDAVAPKECLGDEDPNLRTALTLNQFFTEWLLFEMPYQESTLVGITALRDEISAESRDVLKQIAETQRFSSFKMQWLNPDTSMVLETAGLDSTVLDAGIAAQQLQLVNAIVDEDRQYATRLTITRTDNENVSESVISTVISWLMKKKVLSKEHCDSFREGNYSTPDGWNGTTELEQGKTALASKRNSGVPGCVVWAMELDEQDHRLIYGRWHTRIGIIGNADSCIVNIQLSRYIVRGFIGEAAPPIPSTPRIVKMLFSDEANVVRVGSTFLNDKPIYLTSETLTSKFIPDLTDPDRTLSLILITTDEESKLPVRNLKNLTKQLFGMADIYVLDWHDRALMDTYREVFLKNTPAYDYGMECSSLKIYCKPVDLTVPTDNEMGMAYAKYLIDRYTRYGENRFINVLRQGICRASDRVAGDILSIADVRWLDGIDEAKRLSSRIKKLKQRVKGDSGGNETVDSLRDEISGLQKDIADWEEIASELETSNSEAAAKIDMLTRDAMRLENEKRAVERKAGSDGEHRDLDCSRRCFRDYFVLLL